MKKMEKNRKIEVLQSAEEKAKDIWQTGDIVDDPEAIDIVSDARIRPEYDVKYQQYVGTEDAFLQVIKYKEICEVISSNLIL